MGLLGEELGLSLLVLQYDDFGLLIVHAGHGHSDGGIDVSGVADHIAAVVVHEPIAIHLS